MRELPRSTRESLRRNGVVALMYVVAFVMVIEAFFRLTNHAIYWLVTALHLTRLEEELKKLPWWFAFVLVGASVLNFIFFEVVHYYFLARGELLLFVGASLIKWLSLPVARYFLT